MILSIDPGKAGAIVKWTDKQPTIILDMVYNKAKLDIKALIPIFKDIKTVILEDVHSSPRAGVASSGSFLYNVGVLQTATIFSGATLVLLKPTTWKSATGLYGKPKSKSPDKAKEYYPEAYETMIAPFKNNVDRAEAVLIGAAYLKIEGAKNR